MGDSDDHTLRFKTGGAWQGRLPQAMLDGREPALNPGEQIGVWRIERLLGSGGMSDVYLASRSQASFEQKVALKIVPRQGEMLARFQEERRILARLAHPGIAGLIDGGELPGGGAWFAMEHIDGLVLDDYVLRQRLSFIETLRLFEDLCAAIAHAHSHLLVHRDIKPGNVMVDQQGRVRLLDFGIALGQHDRVSDNDRIMTPGYAAPEQLQGGPITTATDIFQLGLTLQTVLNRANQHGFAIAPASSRSDLAAVIARATAPAAADRYHSAMLFRDDLIALREARPVSARAGGEMHRLVLGFRRHPFSSTLIAALAISLVLSGVLLFQSKSREAEERSATLREEGTATAIGGFFVELFNQPVTAEGGVAELLDRGQQRLLAHPSPDQRTHAALLHALAKANIQMERPDAARPLLEAAIGIARQSGETGASDLALYLSALARLEWLAGRREQARGFAAETEQTLEQLRNQSSHTLMLAHQQIGEYHLNALEYESAKRFLERAVLIGEARYGADSSQLFQARQLLVSIYRNRWEVREAAPAGQRLLDDCKRYYGESDAVCIIETTQQARVLGQAGEMARAEAILRAQLAENGLWTGQQRLYRQHAVSYDLSENLWFQGRYQDARRTLIDSLGLLEQAMGRVGPHWLSDHGSLALLLVDMGDPVEALRISNEGVSTLSRPLAERAMEDHFWVVRHAAIMLANDADTTRLNESMQAAVSAMSASFGSGSYFSERARLVLARMQVQQGQLEAAEASLHQVEQANDQGLQVPSVLLAAEAKRQRARIATARQQPEMAKTHLESMLQIARAGLPQRHPVLAQAMIEAATAGVPIAEGELIQARQVLATELLAPVDAD
ncbi:hypothetical protein C7S18_18590 [Ahniella affigens]|uniref:Protein kinase domain-containing protein n=1 Tax=Ahniella affigens TaxID=2021234 RepID=A0A2P1PW21_9GAMM|nr:protein kinase [Ahniella affigens]AVP99055.1 hypothetical protein C7S18_18590 [Ahniella affigens]